MGSSVRRATTASGATAVQIVHKKGRAVLGIEHTGSAHDGAQLTVLLQAARERLHVGQGLLPLETPSGGGRPLGAGGGRGDGVADRVAGAARGVSLVLGRIIEPTSKADTVRVLTELGVPAPTRVTFMRCLKRVVERDYRQVVSDACFVHATRDGGLALVLYDVTTLYFEAEHEDACAR